MTNQTALLLVDIQKDCCGGCAFAVPGANSIIPLVNQLQKRFPLVVATKDWHPYDHVGFARNHPGKQVGESVQVGGLVQTLWPDHCIQDTPGAEFHDELDTSRIATIIYKGKNSQIDSYSAFYDNARLQDTGLAAYLHDRHVRDVYLLGLAFDYCVKYSALDAKQAGFNVYVISDACRPIGQHPADYEAAVNEMRAAGIMVINSSDIKLETTS